MGKYHDHLIHIPKLQIQPVNSTSLFQFRLVLKKYNLHFADGHFWCVLGYFPFLYEIVVLLMCSFCGFNSHWCTVQWGVVMYYEEKDNMQMSYKVCFIFKWLWCWQIFWFIKILRKVINLPKCVYFNKCIKLYCVPLHLNFGLLKKKIRNKIVLLLTIHSNVSFSSENQKRWEGPRVSWAASITVSEVCCCLLSQNGAEEVTLAFTGFDYPL